MNITLFNKLPERSWNVRLEKFKPVKAIDKHNHFYTIDKYLTCNIRSKSFENQFKVHACNFVFLNLLSRLLS